MTRQAVVIGGGHNGLVAANYLARAGWHVTLIERRESLGGVVGRFEYLPGFASSITNSPGSFEGTILEELQLQRYGLRFHRPEATLLHPMGDSLFVGWRDQSLVKQQLDSYANGEYDRHRSLVGRLDALGAAAGMSLWQRPESLESVIDGIEEPWRSEFERDIVHGTLRELLDSALDSDEAKSLMMMLALNGQLVSPDAAGSAFGLMLRPISRASSATDPMGNGSSPLRGSVGLPIGSMAAIVDALVSSALAHGVQFRLGAHATELELNDEGRVAAIRLETGERITGMDATIATVEPSRLAGMLPADWQPETDRPSAPSGSAFKIALALDGLPGIRNAPEGPPPEALLEAQFRIGPSTDYITDAVEAGIRGEPSSHPIIWGLIPSLTSPGIAPDGHHLMSLNVWHAPHALGAAYWRDHGAEFADQCIAQVETAFPGTTDRIVDRRWLGPHELEAEFGLTSSNITHGDMLPEHMLNSRPGRSFTAALEQAGVVLGGAGAWPGGYVTGIPGRNSAARVLTMDREFAA